MATSKRSLGCICALALGARFAMSGDSLLPVGCIKVGLLVVAELPALDHQDHHQFVLGIDPHLSFAGAVMTKASQAWTAGQPLL